jgi:hypothetical protein
MRNRTDIGRAFGEVRDFRNLVAHHQPIWDRHPVQSLERALELLHWMNPSLAAVTGGQCTLEAIFDAGHTAFRAESAQFLKV